MISNQSDLHFTMDYPPMPDTAVVLAGGLGTRLRAAVVDCPKTLAPVAGKPFLAYLLSYLAEQGIHRVLLSLGYLAEQVVAFILDGEQRWKTFSLHVTSSERPISMDAALHIIPKIEKQPLGTGGALRYASEDLLDPFFVLNGDTLFRVELSKLWQFHLQVIRDHPNTAATLSLRRIRLKNDSSDLALRGSVHIDSSGMIMTFDEKSDQGTESTLQRYSNDDLFVLTNGGVYIFQPDALADIPQGKFVSLEREVFPNLATASRLAGLQQEGYFVDIGSPESLSAFEDDVEEGVYEG